MSFTERTAYREGHVDAQNGKEFYENPYPKGTPARCLYRWGWEDVAGELDHSEEVEE